MNDSMKGKNTAGMHKKDKINNWTKEVLLDRIYRI